MLSLEVIPLPVSDVDRSIAFYVDQLGFVLDVDYRPTAEFRVVQLTPPGSACSIHLVAAGSSARLQNLHLVTSDLEAERARLVGRGVAVSEPRHKDRLDTWAGGRRPGLDRERRDYASFADLTDPDGNTWILQERGHRAA
jgi:catechol 2,3-dioxygenase-like lactoylglutathione lyase family enzyme